MIADRSVVSVHDLVLATPTDGVVWRFTIQIFDLRGDAIIDVGDHGRAASDITRIHADIETYRPDPLCEHLTFFIYDLDIHIADRAALKDKLKWNASTSRSNSLLVLVKP